jgi:hypothetical protein
MSNYGPPPGSPQDPYGQQQPQNPYGQPASSPYGQQPYGAPPAYGGETEKGFWGSLFDFSFTHFATPKIVKLTYIIATVLLVLMWLAYIAIGFSANGGLGVAALIGGGIAVLLYLCFTRLALEFFLSVNQIRSDVSKRLK